MRRLTIVSGVLLTILLIVDHGASLPTAQGQDASLGDISVKLLLPHSKGNTGDTVPAEIRFQDAVDVGAFQMALLYDEKLLEFVSVDQGALLGKNAIFEFDNDVKGRLGLGFLSGPDASGKQLAKISQSGVIAVVHFKVLGTGPRRTPLSASRVRIWDIHDAEVTSRTEPGEFAILGPLPWFWIFLMMLAVFAISLLIYRMRRRRSPLQNSSVA